MANDNNGWIRCDEQLPLANKRVSVNQNNHLDQLIRDKCGNYFYIVTRTAWEAWQASRESFEIELPESFIANETWCYDEDLVNQALISNGLKIKNE